MRPLHCCSCGDPIQPRRIHYRSLKASFVARPDASQLVGLTGVHLAFLSSGVTRQPLVIPTAFDGEDVAELESPSGGHAPDRATDMILRDAQ